MTATDIDRHVHEFQKRFSLVAREIAKRIVGQEEIVRGLLIALFAKGHVLLEGIPGLGKTSMVHTVADVLHLKFSRIQFTPDLMPADIVGTNVVQETPHGEKYFEFQQGPIFANIVLADEVNRATPKTQSALLEAMQERSVSVGKETHRLDLPFFVLATQNPLEMEGTYPLPEAQLDRFFFKLKTMYPSPADLHEILNRTTQTSEPTVDRVLDADQIAEMTTIARSVPISKPVQEYAIRLTLGTHPQSDHAPELVNKYVRYGSSPRGAQALVIGAKINALLDDRVHVSCDDIRAMAYPALRHRVLLNFEGEAEQVDPDSILRAILEKTPEPRGDM
ncbi:MAG: MoxR family ATPase [Vicinamibacterales bacterium]